MANEPNRPAGKPSRGTTGERRVAPRPVEGALPVVEKTPRQKLQTALGGESEFSVRGRKPDLKLPDTAPGAPAAQGGPARAWHYLRKIFK